MVFKVKDQREKSASTLLAVVGLSLGLVLATAPSALAGTLTVNRAGDAPDANVADQQCDSNLASGGRQCTFRAAIQQANATSGRDQVDFNIRGKGRHTISPTSALPPVTDTIAINGYSEPGAIQNTRKKGTNAKLMIVLDGSDAGPGADGLVLNGVSDSLVRGLVVKDFTNGVGKAQGIVLDGPAPGMRSRATSLEPLLRAPRSATFNGAVYGSATKTARTR